MPQVRAGSIKAYAVTAKSRLAAAPDIPTVDEAGVPGFHVSIWTALFAPKGTPKAVIAKLNAAVVDALADPAVRKRLADLWHGAFPARTADAGSARRLSQGRDRQMVADHQGGEYQGRMISPCVLTASNVALWAHIGSHECYDWATRVESGCIKPFPTAAFATRMTSNFGPPGVQS